MNFIPLDSLYVWAGLSLFKLEFRGMSNLHGKSPSLSQSLEITYYATFYDKVVENEAHFVLKCLLYNSLSNITFSYPIQNVIWGSLKSFFQVDHQVDIYTKYDSITNPSCLDQ